MEYLARGRNSDLPPGFQEVKLGLGSPLIKSWAAKVRLPGGVNVRFDRTAAPDWIGAVVQALQRSCSALSSATRVFLATRPIEGRKSFNGLSVLIKETLQQEPTSGFLFVFINKGRNRLKVLFWDDSGLVLCIKRLESGRFAAPWGLGQSQCLRPGELTLVMHGMEGTLRRRWLRI